jgi:predicted ArsR family transcriptional regulator
VRTRDAVARLILESGPRTAAELAERLNISPAAVRRHLDALVDDGLLEEREARVSGHRGRGRPPRAYALTDAGRAAFPHGYDDLATMAVRFRARVGGRGRGCQIRLSAGPRAWPAGVRPGDKPRRVAELAEALTDVGYASTTERAGRRSCSCVSITVPVAHVAAEFPQLCEAETRAFERVLGTYVQRLATIARGDGVCTTYIPDPPEFHGANR